MCNMLSTDLPGNHKSKSECPTVEDVVVQYRFELFMMVHKLIIISFIPSLVSDRYSFAVRAQGIHEQIKHTCTQCTRTTTRTRLQRTHAHCAALLLTYAQSTEEHAHACSATSFLLVSFVIEYINVILTSHLRPFVEPSLDRLNMGTLVITCLVLFYGCIHRTAWPSIAQYSMAQHPTRAPWQNHDED